jgi:hypothetical protein
LEILYFLPHLPPTLPPPAGEKGRYEARQSMNYCLKTNPLQTAEEQQLDSLADWVEGGGGEDGGEAGMIKLRKKWQKK